MATAVEYILKVNAESAEQGLENVAKEAKKAASELDKLGAESKDAAKAFDQTESATNKTSKGLAALKTVGSGAANALAGVGAVAAGSIVAIGALGAAYFAAQKAAFDFTREVVDSVNQLNDLSAQSGLSANSIQAVITAFEGSGQSAQAAEAFIGRFPRLFADLSAGAGRASEAAEKLGVSLTDASGATKSADEVLIDVTRGLQSIEDPTERATQGFLLLGRSAGQFLQAFGATSDFENFLELSNLFGVQTGPKASAAAAKFQEQLAFVQLAVKGLRQQFVNVLGGVEFFNNRLLDGIKIIATLGDFITDNEKIFQDLGNSLKTLGFGILQFFQFLIQPLASFVNIAFKIINDQIIILARGLKELGVLSNDTFLSFAKTARAAENAVSNVAELAIRFGDVDFQGSGRGVSGRQSAARAEELIGNILAGVSGSSRQTTPEIDTLSGSVENLGKSAKETVNEIDKDADAAFKNVLKVAESFEDIDPAVKRARDTVNNLKVDIFTLEAAERDTTFANQLLAEAEERLAKARKDAAEKADIATKKQIEIEKRNRERAAQNIIGIISDITSLNISNIAGLFSPTLSGAFGILQSLGEKTPEEIRQEALAQAEAIKNGIAILPELILSILPQLAVAITEAIIDGFLLIFVNIKNLIQDAFSFIGRSRDQTPDGERIGRQRRRQFLLDFINPMESASFMGGGRFVPSAQGGIRFTGMQDGLAMLHRGEFVVPQSGQRPQQVDRQLNRTTGGGMTININSAVVDRNAVDALVREIEIRFNNQFGTSSSNLFGGR